MASERDLELLDDYVGNRLSAQERSTFEEKLATDAELRSEFQLQEKIVESLRKARAAELKQVLQDIPLSSIPSEGMSTLTQVGIWVVAASLAGAGLYYLFSGSDANSQKPADNPQVVEELPSPTIESVPEESTPNEETPVAAAPESNDAQSATVDQPATTKSAESKTPDAALSKTTDQKKPVEEAVTPATPSPLDVFDPAEEVQNERPDVRDDGQREESATRHEPSIVVETAVDKRYNFHYQFKNDKLYLYGSFEKGLYEIMEFFSNNKRTMFLYYKENYYLLNEESDKVKPLSPITDPALLQKLKDYRGH